MLAMEVDAWSLGDGRASCFLSKEEMTGIYTSRKRDVQGGVV